jgi:hypothetical protein
VSPITEQLQPVPEKKKAFHGWTQQEKAIKLIGKQNLRVNQLNAFGQFKIMSINMIFVSSFYGYML